MTFLQKSHRPASRTIQTWLIFFQVKTSFRGQPFLQFLIVKMKVIVGKFSCDCIFCCHRLWTKRFSTSLRDCIAPNISTLRSERKGKIEINKINKQFESRLCPMSPPPTYHCQSALQPLFGHMPHLRVTQSTVTHRAQKLFVNKLERDQAHNKQQLKMQLKIEMEKQ